jgi:hypothetical protein
MPVRWKIFRVVCIVQLLAASIFGIMSLINFFQSGQMGELLRVLLFVLIFMLAIFAVNIINNNYPDTPVTGTQKTNFNRLFILNFLFLVFMFGILFAEYQQLNILASLFNQPLFSLPFKAFIPIIINLLMLIFQFFILYGLYELRRELYFNFKKKEFEFEKR